MNAGRPSCSYRNFPLEIAITLGQLLFTSNATHNCGFKYKYTIGGTNFKAALEHKRLLALSAAKSPVHIVSSERAGVEFITRCGN